MKTVKHRAKQIATALVGGVVLLVGIVTIPYPGPGWLTVFAGLAILSTEFKWAKDVLHFAKGKYDAWQRWLSQQHPTVRVAFWAMTATVVVMTLWFLNGYGYLADFIGLDWDWVYSPVPIFDK